MANDSATALKKIMFDAYDGFADKRFKDLTKASRFIVDGRTHNDIAADGSVYGWFCSMFLDVVDGSQVELTILNIPQSAAVEKWIEAHAKTTRYGMVVTIMAGEQHILANLAKREFDITRRGNRYDTPHYKYAVPRVVDALDKLVSTLNDAWSA